MNCINICTLSSPSLLQLYGLIFILVASSWVLATGFGLIIPYEVYEGLRRREQVSGFNPPSISLYEVWYGVGCGRGGAGAEEKMMYELFFRL